MRGAHRRLWTNPRIDDELFFISRWPVRWIVIRTWELGVDVVRDDDVVPQGGELGEERVLSEIFNYSHSLFSTVIEWSG